VNGSVIRPGMRKQRQHDEIEEERAYEKSEQVNVSWDGEVEEDVEDGNVDYLPKFSWWKLWMFSGPGFLMSIAYLDPGNIESDLQSGATAGYALLWLLMWATIMGLLIQMLAARLGVATGRHLAELCRDEYPVWARMFLWIMTEVAIIGADVQQVIGSAIAFRILSNGYIPLWLGVLITGVDGFLFLFLENFGVRKLEALFCTFIAIMALSFAWMFGQTNPDVKAMVKGLVIPSVPGNAVDKAVGIVGAVIMPHNIFLHSALVQSRNIDITRKSRVREAQRYYNIESAVALFISFLINLCIMAIFAKAFFGKESAKNIGLANAGEYLQQKYGGGLFPILYIWAIGLLAAGQSSTMTGTYTGQFVMAGFLDMRVKKWIRVLVTRLVAIVPTVAVALLFDSSENELDQLSEWLNVLQSIQLPFALIPLLCLVSNVRVMGDFVIGTVTKVKYFPLEVCRTFKCSLCIEDLLQVQNSHPFGQCFTQHLYSSSHWGVNQSSKVWDIGGS
jgi:NRAMP (natural resistance-associated macrophage protein)-like metal ion transporter